MFPKLFQVIVSFWDIFWDELESRGLGRYHRYTARQSTRSRSFNAEKWDFHGIFRDLDGMI